MNLATPLFILIFVLYVIIVHNKIVMGILEEIGTAFRECTYFVWDKPWISLLALAVFGLFAHWFFSWP